MKKPRKYKGGWLSVCLFFAVIFIVAAWMSWDTIYYSFQEQVEVYDTDEGYDYAGKGTGGNVTADIDFTLGEAGHIVTTTRNRLGIGSASTKYYYIIPVVFNKKSCFVCTEVRLESQKTKFDALMDGNGKSIHLTGTFKKLDNKIYNYMVECMEDFNKYYDNELFKDESELKEHVLPVCLVPLDFEVRNFAIGALCAIALISIFSLFLHKRSLKKSAAKEAQYQARLEALAKIDAVQAEMAAEKAQNTSTPTTDTLDTTETKEYHNTLDEFNDKHNQ